MTYDIKLLETDDPTRVVEIERDQLLEQMRASAKAMRGMYNLLSRARTSRLTDQEYRALCETAADIHGPMVDGTEIFLEAFK